MKVDDGVRARFWDKVNKRNPDECWEWKGKLNHGGYGILCIGPYANNNRKQTRAHRISWELHNGPIPEGALVLHKCDNRSCVNPHHLYLGTYSDNSRDYLRRGRRSKVKLNPEAVREIREFAKTGTSIKMLASKYGVSKRQIGNVVSRKSWRWIE